MASYEILHKGAFPIVNYSLEQGERLKAEAGAMIAMSPTIEVTGGTEGGLLKGLTRMLAGEKFFFQYLTASKGAGDVIFAHAIPGDIIDVVLDGTNGLKVAKDGFLAATEDIQLETKTQNLAQGLFGGAGFFVLSIKGSGHLFLSSYGSIHKVELEQGRELIVDNGHLVAWSENMNYKIEKASKSFISSLTSGEGLICRFTGPGVIYIQTRNPGGFADFLRRFGLGSK